MIIGGRDPGNLRDGQDVLDTGSYFILLGRARKPTVNTENILIDHPAEGQAIKDLINDLPDLFPWLCGKYIVDADEKGWGGLQGVRREASEERLA